MERMTNDAPPPRAVEGHVDLSSTSVAREYRAAPPRNGQPRVVHTAKQRRAVERRPRQELDVACLCGTDAVAKLSPFTHETRRLSDGHVDGVAAVRHRADAVDAT